MSSMSLSEWKQKAFDYIYFEGGNLELEEDVSMQLLCLTCLYAARLLHTGATMPVPGKAGEGVWWVIISGILSSKMVSIYLRYQRGGGGRMVGRAKYVATCHLCQNLDVHTMVFNSCFFDCSIFVYSIRATEIHLFQNQVVVEKMEAGMGYSPLLYPEAFLRQYKHPGFFWKI